MNKAKTLGSSLLVAASCAVPAASLASPCAGTNINYTVTWSPSEIGKGGKLSILRFTSVIVSDSPGTPYHLASGECVGSFLFGPDGKILSEAGYCARQDKDGDVLNEEWVGNGSGKGTSKVVGGTGKFAKASWTFSWQHTRLHGPSAAVRWSGDCR
jgi:hypothetical protein